MNLGGWETPQMSLWEGARGRLSKEPLLLLFQASGLAVRGAGCLHILTPCHCQRRWVRWAIERRDRWKRKSKVKYIRTQAADRQLNLHYPELIFEIMRGKVPPLFLEVGCRNGIPTFILACYLLRHLCGSAQISRRLLPLHWVLLKQKQLVFLMESQGFHPGVDLLALTPYLGSLVLPLMMVPPCALWGLCTHWIFKPFSENLLLWPVFLLACYVGFLG